jgi:quinolinate synthase
MGISEGEMLVWDVRHPPSPTEIQAARIILWPGACNVHQRFRPADVARVRAKHPGIRVIVHPECPAVVVEMADDVGSTAHIINQIAAAGPGSRWAVGTESRLVHRLQREHPDRLVIPLTEVAPYCATMGQITLGNLANLLTNLAEGELINEVKVEAETARWAEVALQRMLALG